MSFNYLISDLVILEKGRRRAGRMSSRETCWKTVRHPVHSRQTQAVGKPLRAGTKIYHARHLQCAHASGNYFSFRYTADGQKRIFNNKSVTKLGYEIPPGSKILCLFFGINLLFPFQGRVRPEVDSYILADILTVGRYCNWKLVPNCLLLCFGELFLLLLCRVKFCFYELYIVNKRYGCQLQFHLLRSYC